MIPAEMVMRRNQGTLQKGFPVVQKFVEGVEEVWVVLQHQQGQLEGLSAVGQQTDPLLVVAVAFVPDPWH